MVSNFKRFDNRSHSGKLYAVLTQYTFRPVQHILLSAN